MTPAIQGAQVNGIFGGPIEIGYVDQASRLWRPVMSKPRNLILYQASDILGHLLAGDTEYVPSVMYFHYLNTADTVDLVDAGRDYSVEDLLGLTGIDDCLRVPLAFKPDLDASNDNFTANQVFFFAVTSGDEGLAQGLDFSEAADSKVVAAAIAASPTGNPEDDLLLARFTLPAEIAKIAGSQIGIKWAIQFP